MHASEYSSYALMCEPFEIEKQIPKSSSFSKQKKFYINISYCIV